MKDRVIRAVVKASGEAERVIENLIEIPKDYNRGDYALPCFHFAKKLKKNPEEIAKEIAIKIRSDYFEKVEASGHYINFFVDRTKFVKKIMNEVQEKGNMYGSINIGKNKKIVIEMSSPNIAKPFGIGHLRSTIIGNSISKLFEFAGYKTVKINYLGDWGTQFGRMIVGWENFGKEDELTSNPIKHLFDIYVMANEKEFDDSAREWFQKLESGNPKAEKLWKKFRDMSLKDFQKIYALLGVKFDVISGESKYNKKIKFVINELKRKNILQESDGALIVNLERHGLGVALIKKSDGATLYLTRDLAAAIDRFKKYGFSKMIYEVGAEQKLHFQQFFKILEILGYEWSDKCIHVEHGFYLDGDGKRFSTRKGKTVFMEDVLNETFELAKIEVSKRNKKIKVRNLNERARKIAVAAIFYGDLKNPRRNDVVFDLDKFLSFEGDTGPYLLYSYARAKSIIRKSEKKIKKTIFFDNINDSEKKIVVLIGRFSEIVTQAYLNLAPNVIANYAYELAKNFNEFYHENQVLGSDKEELRLAITKAFSQTLKNALKILGISVIEEM